MRVGGKYILWAILASALLLGFYMLVMGLSSGSLEYTLQQLDRLKLWIIPLILGFGIQVGLFAYLKDCQKSTSLSTGSTLTGGGTSAIAMLACCAHHLTDVFPLLGLTVAAAFLSKFQVWFLILGIIANLIGILILVRQLNR